MSRHIRVYGEVQGVWYRGWTVDQAEALGLRGWVRNRRDGGVEILADGTEEAIEDLIARCRQGPAAARVERIESEETEEAAPPGFTQRPTL